MINCRTNNFLMAITESFSDDDHYFFVMELATNDLSVEIGKEACFSLGKVLFSVASILLALEFLHEVKFFKVLEYFFNLNFLNSI